MSTILEKITNIGAILASQPRLTDVDRLEYDRIFTRLCRAKSDFRRATQAGDAKKIAAAERAIARAKDAREAIVGPVVAHLWAPDRIIASFEGHWTGKAGSGVHRQTCEMVLDHRDISGPSYRTVRIIKDEGAPPTNPRPAPSTMGVAWHAIDDQIKRGKIVVLEETSVS